MNNNYECPICMIELLTDPSDNYINFAITNCGHKFCLPCIIRYGKKKNICPLCRNEFLDPKCFTPNTYASEEDFFSEDVRVLRDNQELRLDGWIYNTWQEQVATISDTENNNEYRNFLTAFQPRNRRRSIAINNIRFEETIDELFTEDDENFTNEPEPEQQDFSDFYYEEEEISHEEGPFEEEIIAIENDVESEQSETFENISLGDSISNRAYDYYVNLSDTDSSYTSDIDTSSNTL